MLLKKILRKIRKKSQVFLARRYKGVYLPLHRANEHLNDDVEYINSAIQQIGVLEQYSPLSKNTRVLDFGCGQGRFANGLLLYYPELAKYSGIDTDLDAIKWCKRWIQKHHPHFTFLHVDAHNARYNPTAILRPELPLSPGKYNIAFLNSVFSHMVSDDVNFYLGQINQTLDINGVIYLTAFIEKNVPAVEENPPGYLNRLSTLPLHRVRYEEEFFFNMVTESDFKILHFDHQGIQRTKQSVLIAEKIGNSLSY